MNMRGTVAALAATAFLKLSGCGAPNIAEQADATTDANNADTIAACSEPEFVEAFDATREAAFGVFDRIQRAQCTVPPLGEFGMHYTDADGEDQTAGWAPQLPTGKLLNNTYLWAYATAPAVCEDKDGQFMAEWGTTYGEQQVVTADLTPIEEQPGQFDVNPNTIRVVTTDDSYSYSPSDVSVETVDDASEDRFIWRQGYTGALCNTELPPNHVPCDDWVGKGACDDATKDVQDGLEETRRRLESLKGAFHVVPKHTY